MNARERRGYLDRMRKNQQASLCPGCKRKTRHFTVPGEDGKCDIVCELCQKKVKTGVEGYAPYTPVRLYSEN